MPLPKINTPTYELAIPSTGKKIRYRPFLVKEEKILIMALESEDIKQITDAIVEILSECILTKGVKVLELATFDIEFIFLNVRAKSVGEMIDVNVTCPDDGKTQVQMEIDIDAIKVQKDKKHSNLVKIDEKLSMKMKYPSIQQFVQNNFDIKDTGPDVDQSLTMITTCIEQIYTEEESWSASDSTSDELKDISKESIHREKQKTRSFSLK